MADHAAKLSSRPGPRAEIRRLTSDYLLPPLDTDLHFAYRVTITKATGNSGSHLLILDPNSSILDDFGRTLGSTLMADFEFEVSLVHLGDRDDESLYEVTSRQRLPGRFRLALRRGAARLLTLDADGQITQIVHLHAAVQA